jgi:hypothetical protein
MSRFQVKFAALEDLDAEMKVSACETIRENINIPAKEILG